MRHGYRGAIESACGKSGETPWPQKKITDAN
jgi:hypothetical protein